MEPNSVGQPKQDNVYKFLRLKFNNFFNDCLKKMNHDGLQEATIGCQIGVFNINRLTQMVSLVDKPEIAPEDQNKYDIACKVVKDVVEEKGYTLLEF